VLSPSILKFVPPPALTEVRSRQHRGLSSNLSGKSLIDYAPLSPSSYASGISKFGRTTHFLRDALDRLNAVNRKACLGGNERYAVDMTVKAIMQRLEPTAVHQLLEAVEKVAAPLEYAFRDIDAQAAAAEVLG
jgi:hypothetical protein